MTTKNKKVKEKPQVEELTPMDEIKVEEATSNEKIEEQNLEEASVKKLTAEEDSIEEATSEEQAEEQNLEAVDVEEKPTVSKWQVFKEKSKVKYDEIVLELKNPVKRSVRRRKLANNIMSIVRAFVFIGLAFVIIFPIFQEVTLAFRHPIDLNNKLVNWIPEHFSLFNFKVAAALLDYWRGLLCNFKVSAISTICQLFAASLAGYAFSRLKFRGSNVLFWLIMLTLIVPPQAVALARKIYFMNFDILSFGNNPGFFESLLGKPLELHGVGKDIIFYITSITGQGIRAALFIFLFRQFFRGIPIELEESAQIDGAGVVRTFISVMLPNARGVIVTVALFAFVWQWNDVYYTGMYGISGIVRNGDGTVAVNFPMLTRKLIDMSQNFGNYFATLQITDPNFADLFKETGDLSKNQLYLQTLLNTSALMLMAPLIIGYLFVQRLFIEGVERSGIVG